MYFQQAMRERIERGRQQYGDKFDPSDLEAVHPSIKDAYASELRVKVEGPMGIRTGIVSTTTGLRPAFLLMHRSNNSGSSDVLGPGDRVIGTLRGRKYDTKTPYGVRYA